MVRQFYRQYRYNILTILACTAIVALFIYFAPWGARNYLQLRSEIDALDNEIEALQQQNLELSAEIGRLKEDTEYIEEVARKQFGLLKKNEVVFEFKDKKKSGKH